MAGCQMHTKATLLLPLLNWTGERKYQKKPCGQSCTWKQKKTKYLFSTSHQQAISNHLPGNRASVCIAVALEDKRCSSTCPPSSFLLAFIAEQLSYGMEYALVSVRQLSWLCPFPRSHPAPACWWEGMLERQPWCCCKHCLAAAKTLVYSQHFSSYQYKVQHCEGWYGEN